MKMKSISILSGLFCAVFVFSATNLQAEHGADNRPASDDSLLPVIRPPVTQAKEEARELVQMLISPSLNHGYETAHKINPLVNTNLSLVKKQGENILKGETIKDGVKKKYLFQTSEVGEGAMHPKNLGQFYVVAKDGLSRTGIITFIDEAQATKGRIAFMGPGKPMANENIKLMSLLLKDPVFEVFQEFAKKVSSIKSIESKPIPGSVSGETIIRGVGTAPNDAPTKFKLVIKEKKTPIFTTIYEAKIEQD